MGVRNVAEPSSEVIDDYEVNLQPSDGIAKTIEEELVQQVRVEVVSSPVIQDCIIEHETFIALNCLIGCPERDA